MRSTEMNKSAIQGQESMTKLYLINNENIDLISWGLRRYCAVEVMRVRTKPTVIRPINNIIMHVLARIDWYISLENGASFWLHQFPSNGYPVSDSILMQYYQEIPGHIENRAVVRRRVLSFQLPDCTIRVILVGNSLQECWLSMIYLIFVRWPWKIAANMWDEIVYKCVAVLRGTPWLKAA